MVTVVNSDGRKRSISVDAEVMLDTLRVFLVENDAMCDADSYLFNGAEIIRSQEKEIALRDILADAVLYVGESIRTPVLDTAADTYSDLSQAQKCRVLTNAGVLHGISFDPERGYKRGFSPAADFEAGYFPPAAVPHVNTATSVITRFDKTEHEIAVAGIDSSTLSIQSKEIGSETQFKNETSSTSKSSRVDEYMSARYIVRKVEMEIDPDQLTPNPKLIADLRNAVLSNTDTVTGCCNVLRVLNQWGYYLPLSFSLGGVLYSTDIKTVTEFSQIEKNNQEFRQTFNCMIDGISGKAEAGHTSESSESSSSNHKRGALLIQQIGGASGKIISTTDYSAWATSLDKADTWGMAEVTHMLPMLVLVMNEDYSLASRCINLLNRYGGYPDALALQPFVDIRRYAMEILAAEIGEYD